MTQERILIVEGDITLGEVLQARLKAMGYLVDCAHCGYEALEILKAEWVDLIITSILLQGEMHGFQLLQETKKKKAFANIPVIVQSSKPAMKKVFEKMGVVKYFVKPYSIDKLLDEVERILEKR